MIGIFEGSIGCNLRCAYCYQLFKSMFPEPDLEAVLPALKRLYSEDPEDIIIHGGEPLLLPRHLLEALMRECFRLQGYTAICTNGSLIDNEIIGLFKRYKTRVSLSIDGFYPQNRLRGRGSQQDRREYTEKLLRTVEELTAEGIPVSAMITLHRENAVGDNLRRLGDFIVHLWRLGVSSGKLNPCRSIGYGLSDEELAYAWIYLARITLGNPELYYTPIRDFINNLSSSPVLSDCYVSLCDPFCTQRLKTILPDGSIAGCSFVSTKLPFFTRAEAPSYERFMSLRKIPYPQGCAGCRYLGACLGGCPSEGIGGDWRNKDVKCRAYIALYQFLEEILKNAGGKPEPPAPPDIKEEPVYRTIKRRFPVPAYRKTTVNGITQIEYPERIEVIRPC